MKLHLCISDQMLGLRTAAAGGVVGRAQRCQGWIQASEKGSLNSTLGHNSRFYLMGWQGSIGHSAIYDRQLSSRIRLGETPVLLNERYFTGSPPIFLISSEKSLTLTVSFAAPIVSSQSHLLVNRCITGVSVFRNLE